MAFGSLPSTPPSETERSYYFLGLPSNPKLVARTGNEVWSKQPEDLRGYRKFLAPVGQHAITQFWNEEGPLASRIINAISTLDWAAIDVLRVGELHPNQLYPDTLPVVMLITIQPGTAVWEVAQSVALDCKAVLGLFGLDDIEVEIKESSAGSLSLSSSSNDMQLDEDDQPGCLYSGDLDIFQTHVVAPYIRRKLVAPLRHVSDSIGTNLTPEAWINYSGTKGLYLQVGPAAAKLEPRGSEPWGFEPCTAVLTCRHVVFRGDYDAGQVYRWDGQLSSRRFLSQDVRTKENIPQQVQETIEAARRAQEELEWHLIKFPDGEGGRRRVQLESKAADAQRDANQARIAERIMAQTKGLTVRIGHLLFAQELSAISSATKGPWLRDYALVKILDGVHARPPRNRLPISIADLRIKVQDKGYHARPSDLFQERSTEKEAILSPEIIREDEFLRLQQNERILGKFGALTGLTFGVLNEVKSVTRRIVTKNIVQKVLAWEFCVVNSFVPEDGGRQAPFSEGRDSGSAVWDLEGRVFGMVTAGTQPGVDGPLDTTYVTSMERILRDMEASGLHATLL